MTREEYFEEKKLAEELGFKLNMFRSVPYEEARDICNGMGPACFPDAIIKVLNKLHPSLKIVFDNHDMCFFYGSGSGKDFKECNDAIVTNGELVAKHKYKWYHPYRYKVMWDARKAAAVCQTLGWPAYVAAINQRKSRANV